MPRKISILVLIVLFAIVRPALAQEISAFDAANIALTDVELALVTIQESYLSVAGRYLQVPQTGISPDLSTTAVQDYSLKPTDGAISLADMGFSLDNNLPIAFKVDEYMGPYGPGYVVSASVRDGGQDYVRISHIGFDPAFQSQDWEVVPNETPT